jgi:hypothetical protein
LDLYFSPHTRIDSKYTKHLNVRPETMKLPEESDIDLVRDIWDITPHTQTIE